MASFIELKSVAVSKTDAPSVIKRLLGRPAVTHAILANITLALPHGAWITLYGKPGSGKTTLLRLLTGVLEPTSGSIKVNGHQPEDNPQAAAGYVGLEETEPAADTVEESLTEFCRAHNITAIAARLSEISKALYAQRLLSRHAATLSTTEKLTVNLMRALISDAPVLLLDDVAQLVDINHLKHILNTLCPGRTVILSTSSAAIAQQLALPVMILHEGAIAHHGTFDDIALNVACPRMLDIWVEGLRYDILRKIRQHPGVTEVRLLTADQFNGQRLRITLHSSRYLPSLYNLVSATDLVKVEEIPPSLADILARL